MQVQEHIRYIHLPNGECYIPNGPNLCFVRFCTNPDEFMERYGYWLQCLAKAGGNFARFWLGQPLLDFDPVANGELLQPGLGRLVKLLDIAGGLGIRIKLTFEHFRFIQAEPVAERFPGAASFSRPNLHRDNGGPVSSISEYLDSSEGRNHFIGKMDTISRAISGHPAVFAVELWNEMNAVKASRWQPWTEWMLPRMREFFPGVYCLQSLGSFDRPQKFPVYEWYAALPGNDITQVHCYIDPNPETDADCRGPTDVMAANVVTRMRRLSPDRPVVLAECGAVEAGHSAPSRLYKKGPRRDYSP